MVKMNLLAKMSKCFPQYDEPDGWYVLSYGRFWYVGLIKDGFVTRKKKIGPFRMRGTNYFDRATETAQKRNAALGIEIDHSIPRIKEV